MISNIQREGATYFFTAPDPGPCSQVTTHGLAATGPGLSQPKGRI
jgi:hypothetical protein